MKLPPFGLCLPCSLVRVRDGDTVEVRLREGGLIWAVRHLECWCTDNKASPLYAAAKELAEKSCGEASDAGTMAVFVPMDELPKNLLAGVVSFDRILGKIFLSTETTLGDLLIRRGLAGRRKSEQPE